MSDTEFDDERRRKMEELFRKEWGETDESPVVEFMQQAQRAPTFVGSAILLHALPQLNCDCGRCFYEKIELANYMLYQIADLKQKQRDGEMERIIQRGQALYKELAEEGLDASDMLTISGLLLNGLLYTIAKTVTDKGRREL